MLNPVSVPSPVIIYLQMGTYIVVYRERDEVASTNGHDEEGKNYEHKLRQKKE